MLSRKNIYLDGEYNGGQLYWWRKRYIVKSISGHVKPKTIKFVHVFAYSLLLKNATIKSRNKALEQRLVDKENSLDNMSEKRSMATCMTFVSVG
jgi:hypothetical protein